MDKYNDIINIEYPLYSNRKKMSLEQRSAQFAPFAALVGYNETLKETTRITSDKKNIDEGLRSILNDKLNIINIHIKDKPLITFTYFLRDSKKDGGEYITKTITVKKIDTINKIVIFNDNTSINMDDIININGEIF